jgi:hypothetical protein
MDSRGGGIPLFLTLANLLQNIAVHLRIGAGSVVA